MGLHTNLVEASSVEIGSAILLPDGHTFRMGATGNTGLFTMPTIVDQPASWIIGPEWSRLLVLLDIR
jgi:hypothetical protein